MNLAAYDCGITGPYPVYGSGEAALDRNIPDGEQMDMTHFFSCDVFQTVLHTLHKVSRHSGALGGYFSFSLSVRVGDRPLPGISPGRSINPVPTEFSVLVAQLCCRWLCAVGLAPTT